MRTRKLATTWHLAIVVGLFGLGGCSSATAPDTFVPDFTFVWQVKNDATHKFNLFATFGAASGTFDDSSSETFKGVQNNLHGTFNHRDMQFTTDRTVNGSKASFTGSFVDNDTISLQSPEGTLTVIRIKS
jgi:hypothetical protein